MPKFQKGNTFGFQPGASGNPKGRPKQKTTDESMREILGEEIVNSEGDRITNQELLCRRVIDKAIREGDATMVVLLMKRLWPEVNHHEVSGSLGIEQQIHDAAKELRQLLGINNEDEDAARSDADHSLQ